MSVTPVLLKKTNTTHGTRTQVTSDTTIKPISVYFEPLRTNTGEIYIGDSAVSATNYMARLTIPSATNNPSFAMSGTPGNRIGGTGVQLSNLYIDSSVDGDIVLITYVYEQGG